LKGKSLFGTKTYFQPVYVKGRRQRLGSEFQWTPGSFGLKAEWMQVRDDRLQQSNRNQDLSDFLATGWFVSGTWVVTGESKGDTVTPKKPLFKGGIGAIEVGARHDELGFGSATSTGVAFTNPRSDHLVHNTDRVWTLGVNYFPNRWVRLVINAIHENFEDPSRSIKSGTASFWSGLFRFQLVF
jgi:phosphate-selective porin